VESGAVGQSGIYRWTCPIDPEPQGCDYAFHGCDHREVVGECHIGSFEGASSFDPHVRWPVHENVRDIRIAKQPLDRSETRQCIHRIDDRFGTGERCYFRRDQGGCRCQRAPFEGHIGFE
jgi:hypothetical protein